MTYIPSTPVELVNFPISLGTDFQLQVKMVTEKWTKFFPLLPYYSLKVSPTPAITTETPDDPVSSAPADNFPVGESGTTIFDPLYGESVDPTMLVSQGWRQPHQSSNPPLKVYGNEIYNAPVSMNFRIYLTAQDTDLHQWGFDEIYDLAVVIPTPILDANNIVCKPGDYLIWGGRNYEVSQIGPNNRFLNTSTILYLALNLKNKPQGS